MCESNHRNYIFKVYHQSFDVSMCKNVQDFSANNVKCDPSVHQQHSEDRQFGWQNSCHKFLAVFVAKV